MKANEIFVLSREQAMRFQPKGETYIVRVFDRTNTYFPLICASDPRVVWMDEFEFKEFDIVSGENQRKNFKCAINEGALIFNRRYANELIGNFVKKFKDGMDLMVHCRYGVNRSAGIAVGLNQLFDLGHDYLESDFPVFDRHVRRKIIRAGLFNGYVSDKKKEEITEFLSNEQRGSQAVLDDLMREMLQKQSGVKSI